VTLPRRALLATLALLGAGAARAQSQPPGKGDLQWVEPGRVPSAPLFAAALVDLDHRARQRAAHGRPLIVNFWARWCGPCKVEIPELQALHARQSGRRRDRHRTGERRHGGARLRPAYDMDYALLLARDGSRAGPDACAGQPAGRAALHGGASTARARCRRCAWAC
jgi:hypothetical protein